MENKPSLIIVESPTKSKTIKKYLGGRFEVISSGGHIIDLPENRLGVKIENGFEPVFVPIPSKRKIIRFIKDTAKKFRRIYLASDPDREGEAIAWHISRLIDGHDKEIYRVLFNEITKKGIEEGLKTPRQLDMNKVESQKARRILDRLVGYLISPFLWKIYYKGLSAGRVQTVALRLIVEREEEIERFVPQKYWNIYGNFVLPDGKIIRAKLTKIGTKQAKIDSKKKLDELLSKLKNVKFVVDNITIKDQNVSPHPPYITSTLQFEANQKLKFSATRTMKIAQRLYEGVDLGSEGPVGLITYMRTDSPRIAPEAISTAKTFITQTFGETYSKPRNFKSKSSVAQEAHEAIRPTFVEYTPEYVSKYLSSDESNIYGLIWRKFIASQMADAVVRTKKLIIKGEELLFEAVEKRVIFDGWLRVFPEKDLEEGETIQDIPLGIEINVKKFDVKEEETKPPARFSEGNLVKELESKGIGRPSTYAPIIQTLLERKYVERKKGILYPTELGRNVVKLLVKLFPEIFETGFTAKMENSLDELEQGKANTIDVLKSFYSILERELQKAETEKNEILKETQPTSEHKCEKCGSPMIIKWGKFGRFLACSNFPKCKNIKPVEEEKLEKTCPKCGFPLAVKYDKKGRRFIGCSAFPKCDYTEPYSTNIKCPINSCDGFLVERYTKNKKVFWGCSNYPNCKFASWNEPVEMACPQCGATTTFIKTTKGKRYHICAICKEKWQDKEE